MGINCAPLVADLFFFYCYERDFILSVSDNNQIDIIEAFNSTSRYIFFGHAWGPNEQFDTQGILSWGSKVGQIRYQSTCNIILFAAFQRLCSFFDFFHPNIPFPNGLFWTFSMKQDTFLILKLSITFRNE